MEVALKTSATKEKPSTTRTSKLTPEQALEILAKAVEYCQEVGVDVRGPQPFSNNGQECLVIVLANVRLSEDRRLVLLK